MYKVGDKIKFAGQKQRYTIRACNERYLVCTKPFNARKTYLYTMVDLQEGIRGTDGYAIACYDYRIPSHARMYLKDLHKGKVEISHRNRVELKIEELR